MNITYIIKNTDISIKQILKEQFEMSEKLIIKLKKNQRIFINQKPVYINHHINTGDILFIDLDFDEDSENIIPNSNLPLETLYEDEFLLIVNKTSGIPVHPSILHFTDSLSNSIKYYFEQNNIKRKIRPVNRLDKDTSGIVIFAKSDYIQECLVKQMKTNTFKKYYIAILEGILDTKQGTINAPISRKDNSIIEREISPTGDVAISHYKVLQENNNYSKVEFLLETGRTHQIRLHSKHIGHPVLGDFLYGTRNDNLDRHFLHAYKVEFIHPINKEKLIIETDIPENFKEIL